MVSIGVMLLSSCQKDNLKDNYALSQDEYTVSEEFACSIAENINIPAKDEPLKFNPSCSKSSPKKIKEINSIPGSGKENVCYVINYEGGGFVVLSADKRLMPVLAFSETDEFPIDAELTPAGAVEWLCNVKDEVEKVRKEGGIPDKTLNKEWDNLTSKMIPPPDPNQCEDEYEQVGPLLVTKWHQGCGFNDLLPSMSCNVNYCGKALAGCVPIAMAQIMKFHQHPSSFNWSLMPNTYASPETSRFIKAIHNAIPVSYICNGTGVNTDYNIANALKNSFGYTYASQGSYNYETVTSNLRANKPVMLSGGRDGGWWIFHKFVDGHMWVCDGFRRSFICIYDGNGNLIGGAGYLYLHMNWGWYDGVANGWFAFNNFNPTVRGTTHTYNYKTKMVYNIKP